MTNILYLHNKHEISGGERSLLNLWEHLDSKKYKLFLAVPQAGDLTVEARKLGLEIFLLQVPSLHPLNIFFILKTMYRLAKYIKKNKIHIIHSYTPRNNILSSLVGRFFSVAVIWHERNLLYGDKWDLSQKFIMLPQCVICNSQAVAERFRKNEKIPDKVKVVLNGINLEKFNPNFKNDALKKKLGWERGKIVGIIGNFTERKKIEFFLETMAVILKKQHNVRILMVGGEFSEGNEKGARTREVEGMIERLRLKPYVYLTGFQMDVTKYLSIFDVSAHAAVEEACSRAILESQAAGKPVVVMNDGGNPELVEDGVSGFLIKVGDQNAYVQAIERLLNNDAERLAMGEAARKRMEEFFNVKRNALETEHIYETLA